MNNKNLSIKEVIYTMRAVIIVLFSALLSMGLACSSTETVSDTPTPTSSPIPQGQYSLSIDISPTDGGEVILSNAGPYEYGDVVELTANPNDGYQFDHWSVGVDINSSINLNHVTIYGHTHLSVYFGALDSDNDGLSDTYEESLGTNPYQPDSDNDGLSDYEEVSIGSNPLLQDTDSDGIIDSADLWPLKDMIVDVNITSFTLTQSCDPVDAVGGPYAIIHIHDFPEVQLSECLGSGQFNIADDDSVVTIVIEAWDSDPPIGDDDPIYIDNTYPYNKIYVDFDRKSSPLLVQSNSAPDEDYEGCIGDITIQITNY